MLDSEPQIQSTSGHVDIFTHKRWCNSCKQHVNEDEQFVIHKGKHEPGTKSSLGGQTLHGITVKDVYTDKKEAEAHAAAINKGRGYKPGDEKNSLYGGVLYQVSPRKNMQEEVGVAEGTGVTDYNPKSRGGTRKELIARYHKTKDPKDAEAARRAGATQKELQGVAEGSTQNKTQKELAYNQGMDDYENPEVMASNHKSWGEYARYYIKGWKLAQELEAGSNRD